MVNGRCGVETQCIASVRVPTVLKAPKKSTPPPTPPQRRGEQGNEIDKKKQQPTTFLPLSLGEGAGG